MHENFYIPVEGMEIHRIELRTHARPYGFRITFSNHCEVQADAGQLLDYRTFQRWTLANTGRLYRYAPAEHDPIRDTTEADLRANWLDHVQYMLDEGLIANR